MIQETPVSSNDIISALSSRWSGPSYWSPATGRQGGVAVLVNENFQGKILSWRKDTNGRIIIVLVSFNYLKVNLINVYTPTNLTDRKVFFDGLHEFFLPADAVIIGSDFNCYEHQFDKFRGNVSIANYLTDFLLAHPQIQAACLLLVQTFLRVE